jgi:acyl-CoA synthetase (AMP-forming)/AMP-acid ligase II/thioesterase domain-containing protein/acyl carrier protein
VQGWAERTPDAPALVAKDRLPLSYGALLELADQFRRTLNNHGLGRNDRIAIVHSGGAEMAATIVGVWSCAAAVPMNQAYTVGEFAIYFRDLRVDALLVDATLDTPARQAAQQLGLPVLEVVQGDRRFAGMVTLRQGTERPVKHAGDAQLEDLATVLTTSGTTTHSKVVPIHQRELWWKLANAVHSLELTPEDRCLNLMPLFHGHGITSGLGINLWSGGSTIMLERFDIDTFTDYIQALEPTWYTGAFTFHHQILAHAERLNAVVATSKLRFARSGSGPLGAHIGKEIEEKLGIPVLQAYSATETGLIASNPRPPRRQKHGSVGLPASDGVAIMEPDGGLLPVGQRGEVVVSGDHVFKGYENDPAANAAAFNGDWFRTGDEGMLDEDGFLFLTGRIKETINRGGEKITPSEVEGALVKHPDVLSATVFPIPHGTLGEEVAAAVVLENGAVLSDELLSQFLKKRLTGFKVPRRIVFVDSIPKGPSGKIQRRYLATALGLDENGVNARVTPAKADRPPTSLEATLQQLWAKTLGLDSVGLYDDFFLLGGDSLQAVDLFLAIESQIGHRLPRAVLFEAGTIAEMAARIEKDTPSGCIVPIQPKGEKPPFFCVHDQNGHVLNFRDLARHLGTEQPFYGLQYVGLNGGEVPVTRMEDMAAHYRREIRKIQPAGPYYIGGYSFGGRVAYTIAQQLLAAGENVALLALLDTYHLLGQKTVGKRQWWARHSERLAKLESREIPAYLALRIKNVMIVSSIALRSRLIPALWRVCEMLNRPIPQFLHRPAVANDVIRRNFRPKPYEGDAVLFQAELPATKHPDVHLGWRNLIKGGVDIRPVPGRHFDFLKEPHVRRLAEELADCLAERQERHSLDTQKPDTGR